MKGLAHVFKIKFTWLIFIMSLVFLAPSGAFAYTQTIADNTLVLPYRWTSPSTYPGWTTWTDVIGTETVSTGNEWDVKRVAVTWSGANLTMQIYTNYPQAGLEGAGQTDIALDPNQNSSWNVGVKMSGLDKGKIYTVDSWVPLTGSDTAYRIDVTFPTGFNTSGAWNAFNFELGSGTCGNEVIAGSASYTFGSPPPVPLPGSVWLLGTGVLGLALLGLRRKAAPIKIKNK